MQRKSPVKVKGRAGRKKNMEKWEGIYGKMEEKLQRIQKYRGNDEGDKEKRLLKKGKKKIYWGKRRMKKKKMTKNYAICTNK